MATRFYLHNDAAPYTPATLRGAWDQTAQAVTKRIDASKLPVSTATNVPAAETNVTAEWDVLLYRGVSGPLAAATIGTGTVDVMLPVIENTAAADFNYHLHIYVTQGDSDTPRGTLLSDYREAAGVNEWGTAAATCGRALNAAASLSSLAVSAGDRIVIEIGYAARNTVTTSYTGTLYYGVPAGKADLVAGGPSTNLGYIEFSETLAGTAANRVSQGAIEITLDEDTAPAARVTQGAVEIAIESTGDELRTSQVMAEVAWPTIIVTRLSQFVVEILQPTVIESRVTQVIAELLDAGVHPIRVTQLVVELLGKSSTYCGPPSLSPAALCGKTDVLAWLEWTVPLKES
jgi:hypothetical protein